VNSDVRGTPGPATPSRSSAQAASAPPPLEEINTGYQDMLADKNIREVLVV
jgi:hypothetical protein